MRPSLAKKEPLEQTLDGLTRRGWVTKEIARSIVSADDKHKVVAGHVAAGRVTEPVARTILKRADADAEKASTYDTVIKKHVRRLPDWKD